MSTLKADAIEAATGTNTDLDLAGKGTGVPDIASGFKVGGTAGVPVNNLRVGTDGELITWDASGDPATVAVGTATHVLTSNGAGAAPTFQASAAGGSRTYISTVTASGSATLDFTSGIDSTYDVYVFEHIGLVPATDDKTLNVRFSVASSFITASNYGFMTIKLKDDATTADFQYSSSGTSDTIITGQQIGSASGENTSGTLYLYNPASTSLFTGIAYRSVGTTMAGGWSSNWGGGGYKDSTAAIDGIRFYFQSGNITSGTIAMYGIAKS